MSGVGCGVALLSAVCALAVVGCAAAPEPPPLHERELATPAPCMPDPSSLEDDSVMFVALGCPGAIDGVPVTASAFNAWARVVFYQDQPRRIHGSVDFDAYREKVAQNFLEQEALARAADAAGFDPTVAELDADLDRTYASYGGFEAWAARSRAGRDLEEVRAVMRQVARMGLYVCALHTCEATEQQLRELYDANAERYTVHEEVEASHILFKTSRGASAKEVDAVRKRAEVVAVAARLPGADFAALARKHSEGPSASRGGALGFFTRRRMVKPFEDAAFAAKVGEVVGPIRTVFGWHVLVVTDRRGPGTKAFEEVREELAGGFAAKRRGEAFARANETLRAEHELVPRPESIRVVAPKDDAPGGR